MKHVYQDPVSIGLGLAVFSTAYSVDQQREAAKDSKRAQRAQQRLQDIKAARERRSQVRQAIVAQSTLEARAQATGTSKSSSAQQGGDSVQSQLASNLSFLDQANQLNQQTSIFEQRAASASSRAATGQAVASLSLTGASLFAPKPKAD